MKKIMKKVLSLALVIALAIAPMTVMAASTANLSTFEPGVQPTQYSVDYVHENNDCWGSAYVYNWTPTTNGVLTLTAITTNAWVVVENAANMFDGTSLDPNAPLGTVSFNATANTTYKVQVMNWDEVSGEVEFTAAFVESAGGAVSGSGTLNDPYDITNVAELPALDPMQTAYYIISANNTKTYTLTINGNPMMMDSFTATVNNGEPVYSNPMSAIMVENVTPYASGAILLCITNYNRMGSSTYRYTLEEVVAAPTVGTEETPDTLVLDTLTTANITGINYYYTYDATEAGTLSINMYDNLNSAGWICSISGGASDSVYVVSSSAEVVNPVEYVVAAGETITVWVANEEWSAGQIYFQAGFEAGVTGGGNPGGGNPGGGTSGTEVNYEMSATALEIGLKEYSASNMYPYTIYSFEPGLEGKYTISSTDSQIGIVSNNGMWITVGDSTEVITPSTVGANSVVWECTGEGQSIWVAALPNTNVATITVLREELDKSDEVEWTIYKNKITPTTFKYDGDVDKLLESYVDTADGKVDKAVLGKDGYYHLNSENGEILYVNLNDSLMPFATMVSKGSVTAVYYDKDNKVTEAIEFTTALLEYLGVKDIAGLEALNLGTNPVIYPLTEDLMTMFQKVGETNGWYGEGGFIPDTLAEDAWMFACYYVKGQTTSSTPAPGQNSGAAGGATQAPNTGDNANVAVWAIVMVVAAGAAFVVAESKRRAR